MAEQLAQLQLRADAMAQQLTQSQGHIERLGGEMDKLRSESSAAIAELRGQLATAKAEPRGEKVLNLVNSKSFEPKIFTGGHNENFRSWAKTVKNFCNSQRHGFRQALEWAEREKDQIDQNDLDMLSWPHVNAANTTLYDMLALITQDDALLLVEQAKEQGFEAWRRLVRRYSPTGGKFELDRLQHILQRKQCKNLDDMPSAVDKLQRDIRAYEQRSPAKFPEEFKTPLLISRTERRRRWS